MTGPSALAYLRPSKFLHHVMIRVRRLRSDRAAILGDYHRENGFFPDLKNPKDFTEKIRWLMLYGHTPLHTRCADKIAVRDYVSELVGPEALIPAIMTTVKPADLTRENIREEHFAIKVNNDSGSTIICHDRTSFDWADARKKMRRRMRRNYYYSHREAQYKDIKPAIIVEKLLFNKQGGLPNDLKIYCFNGQPRLVQINTKVPDDGASSRTTFFDLQWNRMAFKYHNPAPSRPPEKPENLDKILDCAARLSAPFRFCRVDLYEADGKVFFGELTFAPNAGLLRFGLPEVERMLGDW
ncbi:MAG: ATP-grasp fold amidoligase family protein, partial [Halocynthiibacter sp.]